MKESHDEGLTGHIDPESCGGVREGAAEALTGAHAGQPSSCEIRPFGVPTPLSNAEGNITGRANGERPVNSAQSETLSMRGNSLHGNREIPQVPADDGSAGRPEKATGCTSGMHACGKSDGRVVPEQPAKESGQSFWAYTSGSVPLSSAARQTKDGRGKATN